MEFTFSIRNGLKESWETFKAHWQFFVGAALVSFLLSFLGRGRHTPGAVMLVLSVASFLWSIVFLNIALAAVDGKTDQFSFGSIASFFPRAKQVKIFLGAAVLSLLIVFGGVVLLVIPGIYFAFRLSFASFAAVDRVEGVRKALRYSWDITKGSAFWTTVLVSLVAGFLYLVGIVLFGIGILITYPLAMIFMAKFYRTLSAHHAGVLAPQPLEVPGPKPEAPAPDLHNEETQHTA